MQYSKPTRLYGRGGGVGRILGVGATLGVGEGLGVKVGVGVAVAVAVGVIVGVGPLPPQMIISLSVQTAVCPARASGTFIRPVAFQSFVLGLYLPPEFR